MSISLCYSMYCNAMPKYVQVFVTVMQLLFSFDQDMRVEKTLIQTLSSTLTNSHATLVFVCPEHDISTLSLNLKSHMRSVGMAKVRSGGAMQMRIDQMRTGINFFNK